MLALAAVVVAAEDPFVGTWKLNLKKSNVGPPVEDTIQFVMVTNGLHMISYGVSISGRATHVDRILLFDGKEISAPEFPGMTMICSRDDANTVVAAIKTNGKEVVRIRQAASEDGKILTVTSQGKDEKGTGCCNQCDL